MQQTTEYLIDSTHGSQHTKNTYGRITNKVAVITDCKYTAELIPLILHYHAVLGPDWPIVFYTSQEIITQHLESKSPKVSASWRRAVEDRRVELRIVPAEFNLTSRYGVNTYLSRPWLWDQLAPAQHVLLFQADAILCANSHHRVEDFFKWDFIGAVMQPNKKLFNGGLSLRNRTMMLDILGEGDSWERFREQSKSSGCGEDCWLSEKIVQRNGSLPEQDVASQFALQYKWQLHHAARPLGYHKIHKNAPEKLAEIAKWCPEIVLTKAGTLSAKLGH